MPLEQDRAGHDLQARRGRREELETPPDPARHQQLTIVARILFCVSTGRVLKDYLCDP